MSFQQFTKSPPIYFLGCQTCPNCREAVFAAEGAEVKEEGIVIAGPATSAITASPRTQLLKKSPLNAPDYVAAPRGQDDAAGFYNGGARPPINRASRYLPEPNR